MEPLVGPQRLILQAVRDLQGDSTDYVEDGSVAREVRMDLDDVRTCLVALEERGYLNTALLINGRSALLTPDGRLALKQWEASSGGAKSEVGKPGEVPVRPKGLAPFDHRDADFFLQLLPGPRDEGGLPDSLLYWKSRVEERDADHTFQVGVIYGPSGCGKSSLVRAGLVPRLAGHVVPVYVEATPGDTEARLLKGLRARFPVLPAGLGLIETIDSLTQAAGLANQKVLLVLDQFEQWLSGRHLEEEGDLVRALRRCDGVRLQALVMVRDDFWMGLTRFMAVLGMEMQQSRNFSAVDLFDARHAKQVLIAFGRAYGALPAQAGPLTPGQQDFVERAVSELAEDGRVVAVRLALFAEMVRGRDWTPRFLAEVGGIKNVGTAFLEQSFGSRQAHPVHRLHRQAAQAVLRALLPEPGTDLKGNLQSQRKLLEVSGYARRPGDFEELLRALDGDLRLITPTEPAGGDPEDPQATGAAGERHYQLTHDYLVPALRDWLTRKQKETRSGRAELRLAERAAFWQSNPESRHLPAWWEWANIRLLTRKKAWTPAQREMMTKAARFHAVRGLAGLIVLLFLGWGVREVYCNLQAESLAETIVTAETRDVPRLVGQLAPYRRWVNPRLLRHLQDSPRGSKERLHASLALLPADGGQVDPLYRRLLQAGPGELPVIRDALAGHRDALVGRLWNVVGDAGADPDEQLRAACALATYDPAGRDDGPRRWAAVAPFVAGQLLTAVQQNPAQFADLREMLRPVRHHLIPSLASACRRRERGETERSWATSFLADYAAAEPQVLADLLMDADEKQFAVFYARLEGQGDRGLPALAGEVDLQFPPDAKDDASERLAKRQANAAVALLRMNQADKVWPLLRHRPPDPRVRSYLVHRLGPLGAETGVLVKRFEVEPDVTVRRALLLALGPEEFGAGAWTPEGKRALVRRLQETYRTAADAGLHAAAEWLLRQWHEEAWLRQTDEAWAKDQGGRERRLQGIRQELLQKGVQAGPRWYLTGQGQTMVVIPGPVEFTMGSPPTEDGRGEDERQHRRRIRRTFALAAKPVTVKQYREFRNEHQALKEEALNEDSPVHATDWHMAAAYCNWLSDWEGLPSDQRCYETTPEGRVTKLKENYLSRTGYRLPTEAEWECACRAGAETSRYYGETEELLTSYAWFLENPRNRAWPVVGTKKPNDLGLFDMHGLVWTWCQERYAPYPEARGQEAIEDKEDVDTIEDTQRRVWRGGSVGDQAVNVRSANRYWSLPISRINTAGFRLARTFP
jgi:formylglycine-generating enzyme required for sulfatase activity